jgi:uncharacterized protein YjiS (DUF1127 family)
MSVADHIALRPSFSETISGVLSTVMRWYEKHSDLGRCAAIASRLNAMSDQELASIGVERSQIVTLAFRRYMI